MKALARESCRHDCRGCRGCKRTHGLTSSCVTRKSSATTPKERKEAKTAGLSLETSCGERRVGRYAMTLVNAGLLSAGHARLLSVNGASTGKKSGLRGSSSPCRWLEEKTHPQSCANSGADEKHEAREDDEKTPPEGTLAAHAPHRRCEGGACATIWAARCR